MPAEGGCLCGAVTYRVAASLRPVIGCHCTQCRKTSGHYVAATAADDGALTVNNPEGALSWYRSSESARRGFCSRCGSSLFWKHEERSYTAIMAGTLEGETGLHTESHIYTADKGDYYPLDPGVPHYPAGR